MNSDWKKDYWEQTCERDGDLEELGEEHMKTGALIVYTSADSVLQIAAHEEIVPIEEQYKICKIARELTIDEEIHGRPCHCTSISQVNQEILNELRIAMIML